MQNTETFYLLASIAVLLGAIVYFWVSFRRRSVIAWPKGAEMQILDGLIMAAGVCVSLAAIFGILGALDDPVSIRNWPRSLRGTATSAAIMALWGVVWRLGRRRAETSMPE